MECCIANLLSFFIPKLKHFIASAVRSASSTTGHQQMHVDHSTIQYHGRMAVQVSALLVIFCTCKVPALLCRLEVLTPAPFMAIPTTHSSRPTLGFPLGTALLLIVIFSLSGAFSCCYHWDRLRSLLRSRHPDMLQEGQHTIISIGSSPSKAASDHKNKKTGKECGLPVIMPGDKVPKFFARPCPHELSLPAAEKDEVEVQVKCSVS